MAIPELIVESDRVKHLAYVTFIATDGSVRHKWSSTNTGTCEADFAKIVNEIEARAIVERLRRGDIVTFPELFDYEELRTHKLGEAATD